MDVIPAIDVLNGRCVRLEQGDFARDTIFGDAPLEMAKRWEASGATILHLVDLDGARAGYPENLSLVEKISSHTALKVELGGGLRSLSTIRSAFSAGAYRIVLGTLPFSDPDTVKQAALEHPDRVLAGLDCKGNEAVVHGWTEGSGVGVAQAVERIRGLGLDTFIYTDVARDGMMTGPSIEGLRTVIQSGVKVIASGGIAGIEDIAHLKELEPHGLVGAIVGRALYQGAIDLRQAIMLGGSPRGSKGDGSEC